MSAPFVVDLLTTLCVLLMGHIVWTLLSSFVRGAVRYFRKARMEDNALTLNALSHSDRHTHLMPLFRGMTPELGVVYVYVEPVGPRGKDLGVTIGVTWWCRLWPGEQRRLEEKAKMLLREGGVHAP